MARAFKAVFLATGGFAALGVTHCDYTAYPLAPTFCDDWCHTLRQVPCDDEPENCVRRCERSRPRPSCSSLLVTLKECYDDARPEDFVCWGEGFNQRVYPLESTCSAERDALIDCEYPAVTECLTQCRLFEATYATTHDAGATSSTLCPPPDVPCDALCWELQQPLPFAEARDGSATDAGSGSDPREEIALCVLRRALDCHNAAPAENEPVVTWSTVLVDCLEEHGFAVPN
ncbi:MAG TPA: hypothetical protein VHO25_12455 [Polyangiaceae bacterium]|nr:hypothetical protein [Polyangiaceae bacterium]